MISSAVFFFMTVNAICGPLSFCINFRISYPQFCMVSLLPSVEICFWPNMWSILVNIPCALQKNVYSHVALFLKNIKTLLINFLPRT